jgi:hypothetical protein
MSVRGLLEETTTRWIDDAGSDVVWGGEHEGRWGVRMRQQVRDFTTVWFDVGDRTLGYEAFVIGPPPGDREEVYRQCLVRNQRGWRVHFALDAEGGVYLRGRAPLDSIDAGELDAILGAVYEAVEGCFRALVRAGSAPEREKKA